MSGYDFTSEVSLVRDPTSGRIALFVAGRYVAAQPGPDLMAGFDPFGTDLAREIASDRPGTDYVHRLAIYAVGLALETLPSGDPIPDTVVSYVETEKGYETRKAPAELFPKGLAAGQVRPGDFNDLFRSVAEFPILTRPFLLSNQREKA